MFKLQLDSVVMAIVAQVKGCDFTHNRRPHNSRLSVDDVVDVVNEPVNGRDHKFAYIVRQNAFQRGWVCVQHARILHAACSLPLAAVLRGFVCVHVDPRTIAAGTAIVSGFAMVSGSRCIHGNVICTSAHADAVRAAISALIVV